MRTKTTDRGPLRLATAAPGVVGPIFSNTVAYWLEDDLGNRISKLFVTSDRPLKLAGRALENVGSLTGWTVARRDTAGVRHIIASGAELEVMSRPFMPARTPAEAEHIKRFNEARRAAGFRQANLVTDERVY
jgi:hypothetical protein